MITGPAQPPSSGATSSQDSIELVDSHAHFDLEGGPGAPPPPEHAEAERARLLERARQAGVVQVVAIGGGYGLAGNEIALAVAATHPGVFPTVGVHPHDVAQVPADFVDRIAELGVRPEVVAIGEIGLDYHYDHSPREAQRRAFAAQLEVAVGLGKPVVIHSREADEDTVALLREGGAERVGGVIHCFTGGPVLARGALHLGFDISVSGILTFKNAGAIREVVREVPLERLLVETDSPWLAPVPHRGKRNEPAYVRLVAASLAQLLGLTLDEVAAATTANARRRFRLDERRRLQG